MIPVPNKTVVSHGSFPDLVFERLQLREAEASFVHRAPLPSRHKQTSSRIAEAAFQDHSHGVALLNAVGEVVKANDPFKRNLGLETGNLVWGRLSDQAEAAKASMLAGRIWKKVGHFQEMPFNLTLDLLLIPFQEGGALMYVQEQSFDNGRGHSANSEAQPSHYNDTTAQVAHDFNNLLHAIQSAVADLQARIPAGSSDEQNLAIISSVADRGTALISQIMSCAADRHAQQGLPSVDQFFLEAYGLLKAVVGPSIEINLSLESAGLGIELCRIDFERIIVNLVENARNALPDGGRIRISTRSLFDRPPVNGCMGPGDFLSISVEDNGVGIPTDVLARVFQPFFTTRSGSGGTGIGLATVATIVRAHGGGVSVESQPNQRTRFEVMLPCCRRDPEAPMNDHMSGRCAPFQEDFGGEGAWYIVDDDINCLRLSAKALAKEGRKILTFDCGEDLLNALEGRARVYPPIMLVTDYSLPGMNGLALALEVRKRFPRVRSVVVSGRSDRVLLKEFAQQRLRFLGKPFSPSELREATSKLLGPQSNTRTPETAKM